MKCHTKSQNARGVAAIVLVVWLGALVLCAGDQWFGNCDAHESDEHHAMDTVASSHGHDEGSDHAPHKDAHENGFCGSLKSTYFAPDQVLVLKAQFVLTAVLCPSFICPEPSVEPSGSLSIRQAKRAFWVLTPEVCLGPAFRSLAPPSFS